MPDNAQFPPDANAYIGGRKAVPDEVLKLPSRGFIYAADTAQNATSSLVNGQIPSGAAATVQVQIDDSSYFLVEQIHILSSLQTVAMDGATVQITDTTTARPWSDVPVPLRDLAGTGASPRYLSDPNLLRPTSTLNVQIVNNTGSAAAFYVGLIGRKIYGMTESLASLMFRRLWFQYVVPFASGLGASAVNVNSQVKMLNDSDFYIKKILSQQAIDAVFAATGGAESQELMALISDTSGDRNYNNQKMPLRLLAGSGASAPTSTANAWSYGQPQTYRKPILVRRNSQIQFSLDNKATSVIPAFNITLEGIRAFDQA